LNIDLGQCICLLCAMPAAKRAASARTSGAKRTKEGPAVKVDRLIVTALGKRKVGDNALPADVVSMLGSMLPLAFASPGSRHQLQQHVLDFAAKELALVESGLEADMAEQQSIVAGADAERAKRVAVEAQVSAALGPKQEHLASTKATATDAKAKLKEAESVAEAGELALATAEGKRDVLQQALETKARIQDPEPLADAPADAPMPDAEQQPPSSPKPRSPAKRSPAKMKSEALALAKQLKGVVDDESLLDAMKISLVKAPPERGEFDTRVLEQLQASIVAALVQQKEAVQALVEGKPGRQAAVDTLTAAKDEALEAEVEAEMAASNEEAALKSAQNEVAALDAHVKGAKELTMQVEAKIAEFRVGPLASFEALRSPPVLEPEAADAGALVAGQELEA